MFKRFVYTRYLIVATLATYFWMNSGNEVMLSGTETCFVRPNRSRRIFVYVVGTQLLISKSPSVMNMISALPLSCISSACGHRILIFNRTLMSKAICVIPKMPLVTLYKILLFTSSLHHTPCITQNTGYNIYIYIYIYIYTIQSTVYVRLLFLRL